jgi:ankyrin repeat protein
MISGFVRWTKEIVDTRIDVLRILVESGADFNQMEPDPKGLPYKRSRTLYTGTPLHRAVKENSVKDIEFLLAHGADPTHPSWSGRSSIYAARE